MEHYEKKGLTQADFAASLGVKQGTVQPWVSESSEGSVPDAASLWLIAKRFGLSAHWLLTGAQPREAPGESYDRFTQETIWATKYGRLDNPQGCARDNIAIYWKVAQGRRGSTELVAYDWMMIDAPFSPKAEWLGAVEAGVSIDGDIVKATRHPSPSAWKIDGGSKTKSERGIFVLPPGTLRRVATAKAPVLRIAGTQRTCQGTIEPAMKARIQSMLASLGR